MRLGFCALVLLGSLGLTACGRRVGSVSDGGPFWDLPKKDVGDSYVPWDYWVDPDWRRDWRVVPDRAVPDYRRLDHRIPDYRPPDYWYPKDSVVTEKVTCVFPGSTTTQQCMNTHGQSCSGVASCTLTVSGFYWEKVEWKSSCGGYGTTVIDGKNESVVFPCVPTVSEKVTCVFQGSTTTQECSNSLGQSCQGVASCTVSVSGITGSTVYWKSSCGGSSTLTSVLDAKNETLTFSCGAPPVSEVVTCKFNSTSIQSCWSPQGSCSGVGSCAVKVTGKSGEIVKWSNSCGVPPLSTVIDGKNETITFKCSNQETETVTCKFTGTTSVQECYSSLGPGCKGLGSCTVQVSGNGGDPVSWKSSCGGYGNTILDGKNETVTFSCGAPVVGELVTCLFKGSSTYQQCSSSKGSCTGLLGCTIYVSGTMGEAVTWKSSCGGYQVTIIDGKSESPVFYCGGYYDAGVPPPVVDGGYIPVD